MPEIKRRLFASLSADEAAELYVSAVVVIVIVACALVGHMLASHIEAEKHAAAAEARIAATTTANLHIQARLADAYRQGYATGQLHLCAHAPN